MTTTQKRQTGIALGFLAPNLIGFLVFTAWPVVYSFLASFTNWNLQRTVATRFVGLGNYGDLVHDRQFWLSMVNTVYLMLGMPVSIAFSLWLAVLLHRKMRLGPTYKALLFLPSVTSGVAIMILWKQLFNPEFGPLNEMIRWFLNFTGLAAHVQLPQWLLSPNSLAGLQIEQVGFSAKQFGLGARDALNLMGVWGAIGGANMLLYLAALTNVPAELLDAAQVDGAGSWKCFRHVTWPQLAPTTFFIVVMSMIGGLQAGFEQAQVMTGGGPAGTTITLAFYIYTKAFQEYQIGYASALSWILFMVIFIVTLINWKFGNKATSYL